MYLQIPFRFRSWGFVCYPVPNIPPRLKEVLKLQLCTRKDGKSSTPSFIPCRLRRRGAGRGAVCVRQCAAACRRAGDHGFGLKKVCPDAAACCVPSHECARAAFVRRAPRERPCGGRYRSTDNLRRTRIHGAKTVSAESRYVRLSRRTCALAVPLVPTTALAVLLPMC